MHFEELLVYFLCLAVTLAALYVAFKYSKMMDEVESMRASLYIKQSFYKQRLNEIFHKVNNIHDGFKILEGKRGTVPKKTFIAFDAEFEKMKSYINSLKDHCK